MENSGVNTQPNEQLNKQATGFATVKNGISQVNRIINLIGTWLFRLRKFVMAAPVLYYALKLASYNKEHLPEQVGINLQSTGEFAQMISRDLAVTAPLMVTAVCLVMMLFSRRTIYPWIISIFSLVLPLLIWVTNVFPA